LSAYDAELLTASKAMADYFEQVVAAGGSKAGGSAKAASNWILGDLARLLNATQTGIEDSRVAPEQLAELLRLIGDGTLSTPMAKSVFEEMFETGRGPAEIAKASGMVQVSDDDAVGSAVDDVIAANPQPVSDYLSGKEAAAKYLVGQVMKATRGKANPQVASRLVEEKLESLR
jgi:aspartyl-tRNA(Asn)/glutamyl-tRNA(Gln) amidotransferase subunit B